LEISLSKYPINLTSPLLTRKQRQLPKRCAISIKPRRWTGLWQDLSDPWKCLMGRKLQIMACQFKYWNDVVSIRPVWIKILGCRQTSLPVIMHHHHHIIFIDKCDATESKSAEAVRPLTCIRKVRRLNVDRNINFH